jgi:hypothetical protein
MERSDVQLTEAFAYHTGNEVRLEEHAGVFELGNKLYEAGYTGYEFVYYLVQHEMHGLGRITHLNFVTSEPVWKRFLEYKASRMEEAREQMRMQRELLLSHRNYGWSWEKILTEDSVGANALARVELAIWAVQQGMLSTEGLQKIVDKYHTQVWELNKSCPEYTLFAPLYKKVADNV